MIKKISIFIIGAISLSLLFSSCWSLYVMKEMENDRGYSQDIFEYKKGNVEFFTASVYSGYDGKRGSAFPGSSNHFVYMFYISFEDTSFCDNDQYPPIILHSFSLTNSKGDTIPYILFYCDSSYKEQKKPMGIHFLPTDSYPIMATRQMGIVKRTYKGFCDSYALYAECHNPRHKRIYVNYDIEVDGMHYVVHSQWRRRVCLTIGRGGILSH